MAPFSPDGDGKAINVLNLKARKLIENAPIKGQCAKHYFYSDPEDMRAEKVLQDLEGEYAEVVRKLKASPSSASDLDLVKLRFFTHLQLHRTEASVERMRHAYDEMQKASHEGAPEGWDPQKEFPPQTPRQLLMQSMQMGVETQRNVADLKSCIVVNSTSLEFVTSDDPAVFTNRYSFETQRGAAGGNFGYVNTGAMLLMPLTPRLLFLCYDADAYRVARANRGATMAVTSSSDVDAFNELQCLKAAHNIYFCSWRLGPDLLAASNTAANRRLDHWSRLRVFVRRSGDNGGEVYTSATSDERHTARHKLVAVSSQYPRPSSWPSTLKISPNPKGIVTGTAVGTVRLGQYEQLRERARRPIPTIKRRIDLGDLR